MFTRRFLSAVGGTAALTLIVVACGGSSKRNGTPGGVAGVDGEEAGAGQGGATDGQSGGASGSGRGGALSRGGAAGAGAASPGGTDGGETGEGANGPGNSGGTAGRSPGVSTNPEYCASGYYDTDSTDEVLTCAPWTICQPGTFLAEAGTYKADAVCTPCPHGSYSDTRNVYHCPAWRKCDFGERVVVEGTPTNDRECEGDELFGTAGALAIADGKAHVLAWDDVRAMVAHYSFDGEMIGRTVLDGDGDEIGFVDMAADGDELFVTGVTYEPAPNVYLNRGYVARLAPDGTLAWQTELTGDGETVTAISMSAYEGTLYVVALVAECAALPDGAANCVETIDPSASIAFYALDTQGQILRTKTLEADTDVSSSDIFDVRVTTNGSFHTIARRILPEGGTIAIVEYDATGTRVAERRFGAGPSPYAGDVRWSREDGKPLYVLSKSVTQDTVYRLGSGGKLELSKTLQLAGFYEIDAVAATDDGVAMVGTLEDDPFLLRLGSDGEFLSLSVLKDTQRPAQFTGLQQIPNGNLLVTGTNGVTSIFATPWPE